MPRDKVNQEILDRFTNHGKLSKQLVDQREANGQIIDTSKKGNYPGGLEGNTKVKYLSPREFTIRNLESRKTLERLTNSGYENPNEEVKSRINNVIGSNITYQNEYPGTIQKIKNTWNGTPYTNEDLGSNANNPGSIVIDKQQMKRLKARIPYTAAHEYGHKEVTPYIDDYENPNRLNNEDIFNLKNKIDLSNNTLNDHDKRPTETKADLNAIRYELYNKGFDVFNRDVDDNIMNKYINSSNNFSTKRLLRTTGKKNLKWLLNNVAENNSNNNTIEQTA